jgi:hypothetical protein
MYAIGVASPKTEESDLSDSNAAETLTAATATAIISYVRCTASKLVRCFLSLSFVWIAHLQSQEARFRDITHTLSHQTPEHVA